VRLSIGFASGFKFGVGLALGGLVVGTVVTLVTIVLTGAVISSFLSGLGSSGASTFNGTGTAMSQPVQLHGDVDVTWTAAPASSGECRHWAAVYVPDRPIDREVLVETQVSSASSGTHVIYGLAPSQYVLDVKSTCAWTFKLTPRS